MPNQPHATPARSSAATFAPNTPKEARAKTGYGIPYPVFARASFGVFGANVAALLRAGVACGWFGIQTWIGGGALYGLSGKLFGSGWTNSSMIAGQHWTESGG